MRQAARVACVAAAVAVWASTVLAGEAPESAATALSLRAAQTDALNTLAKRILTVEIGDGRTLADLLGRAGEAEIRLRLALRRARIVGAPRHYSDGVTEVDVEIADEDVLEPVRALAAQAAGEPVDVSPLKVMAIDGVFHAEGAGRAPDEVSAETARAAAAAPRDELVAVFPIGWQRVTPAGRVQAARDARIRAYQALRDRVLGVRVTPSETLGEKLRETPAALARLDAFVRGLALAHPPRLMPDRVAEIEVAAPVAGLIDVLRDVRRFLPEEADLSDEALDQLMVRLKTETLPVVGRGMPAATYVRDQVPDGGRQPPLPDWAAGVLEARAAAGPPEQVGGSAHADVLAARSAKAKAAEALAEKLNTVTLDGGRTVAERVADDETFRADVATLLESARVAVSRPVGDGRWEVVLRLSLRRLHALAQQGD